MFWDERYWLPRGTSWTDLKTSGNFRYPDIWEFGNAMIFSVVLFLIRLAVECLIFLPIGRSFGWIKEPFLLRIKTHLNLCHVGKGKFKRVSETAWRFLFYTCIWFYGFWVLSDQPQFYDVTECWRNWPHHSLTDGIWWYYVIETSFYCSLIFSSLVIDVRRADFVQMTIHHLITVLLLFLSFTMNMIRVGTMILFSHDIADVFLELGKLCRYAGWETALKCVFVTFMVVWVVTRLIYFPFYIIQSVLFDAPALIQADYRWENLRQLPVVPRIFVLMLLCLLILHIYWTYIIVKIAVKSIQGNIDDIREESDDEAFLTESSDTDGPLKNHLEKTSKVE